MCLENIFWYVDWNTHSYMSPGRFLSKTPPSGSEGWVPQWPVLQYCTRIRNKIIFGGLKRIKDNSEEDIIVVPSPVGHAQINDRKRNTPPGGESVEPPMKRHEWQDKEVM